MIYSDSPKRKICRTTFASKKPSKNPAWKTPQPKNRYSTYFLGKRFSPMLQKTPWKSARQPLPKMLGFLSDDDEPTPSLQKWWSITPPSWGMGVTHPHPPSSPPRIGGPSCSRRFLLLQRQRRPLPPLLPRAIACGVMGGARVKRTTNGWKGSDEGWNPMYHHIWRTGKSGDFWKMGRDSGWWRRNCCFRWKWLGQNGYFISKLKEVPEVSGFFVREFLWQGFKFRNREIIDLSLSRGFPMVCSRTGTGAWSMFVAWLVVVGLGIVEVLSSFYSAVCRVGW